MGLGQLDCSQSSVHSLHHHLDGALLVKWCTHNCVPKVGMVYTGIMILLCYLSHKVTLPSRLRKSRCLRACSQSFHSETGLLLAQGVTLYCAMFHGRPRDNDDMIDTCLSFSRFALLIADIKEPNQQGWNGRVDLSNPRSLTFTSLPA